MKSSSMKKKSILLRLSTILISHYVININIAFYFVDQITIVSAQRYNANINMNINKEEEERRRKRELRQHEREMRRQEREKRRYQQHEETYSSQHYSRRTTGSREYHDHGDFGGENDFGGGDDDDDDDDTDVKIESILKLHSMYKSLSPSDQNPRHVLQGAVRGIKCAFFGMITGLPLFFGMPIMFSRVNEIKGWPGALIGLVLGTLSSALIMGIGIFNGIVQLLIGLWNTPMAISSYFLKGERWDSVQNKYEKYYLDEENERLLNSTQMFQSEVSDRTYYDILDVKPGVTSKEIKRGYYAKAKDLHPDKNPDDDEAAKRFIQLHEAYETLVDPDKRAQYDAIGRSSTSSSSSSGGSNGSLGAFNVGVFFEILFASQPVEPYVGQLAVSSFFSQWMKILQVSSGSMTIESIASLFEASKTQKQQRPVQVALHLRDFVHSFAIERTISEQEFRMICIKEAQTIAENSFGETFLLHIGNALVQESNLFLSRSWFGWPLWMMTGTKKKTQNFQKNIDGVKMITKFVKTFILNANNDDDDNNDNSKVDTDPKDDSWNINSSIDIKMLEEMLPYILEMAWAYNAKDIATLLEEACEKVFFDSKVETSGESRRKAKALRILGETFVKRGQEKFNVDGGGQCSDNEDRTCKNSDSDANNIKARIEVAFRIAQQQSRQSNSESEEMINKAKARFN